MSSPAPERPLPHVPEVLSARHLAATLKARWPILLVAVLLGLAAGVGLSSVMPTHYQAVATVRTGAGIVPAGQIGNDGASTVTEAQLATMQPQLESIGAELDLDAKEVGASLNVADRSGTSLIDFTFSAPTAAEAERGADTATEVYLRESLAGATAKIDARVDLLRSQIATASRTERAGLVNDLETLLRTVVDRGVVVRDAQGSAERSLLAPPVYLAIGAAAGLVLGMVVLLLVESWRPKVRRGSTIAGLHNFGHLSHQMSPTDAAQVLNPAIVKSGRDGLALVPLGDDADAVTELISRTVPGVTWVDPEARDDLFRATERHLVAVVRLGTSGQELRVLATNFRIIGQPLLGLVTADTRTLQMADRVLDEGLVQPTPRLTAVGGMR